MSQLFAGLTAHQTLLDEGNRHFSAGNLVEARRCYEKAYVLNRNSKTAYSLGLVSAAAKNEAQACLYYRQSLSLDPSGLEARVNLANILRDVGDINGAVHHHLVALAFAPQNGLVRYNLALTLDAMGRVDVAAHLLRLALSAEPSFALAKTALRKLTSVAHAPERQSAPGQPVSEQAPQPAPDDSNTWTDHGSRLLAEGKADEALEAQDRALAINPLSATAHHNRGAVLQTLKQPGQAIACYQVAIALHPHLLQSWLNLALSYRSVLQPHDAWDAFFVLTRISNDVKAILPELAETSRQLGKYQIAIDCMKQLETLLPDNFMVQNNLGSYFLDLGRSDEALACFHKAARLNPASAHAQTNIGAVHELLGEYNKSYDHYNAAVALEPDAQRLTRLLHTAQHLCRWDNWDDLVGQLEARARQAPLDVQPFSLLAIPDITAGDQRASGEVFARKVLQKDSYSRGFAKRVGKIRLGYVSSDLYDHATAWLIAEIFELHNRDDFEVFAYSYGAVPESATRQRLRKGVEHFHDIHALNDDEAAQKILDDKIDIVLDLKGYTRGGRPGLFARRPAPVQINYLGFPGTSGAPFIDYIIADDVVIPPTLEPFYSETVLRLPHCYQPNDRKRALPPPPSRTAAGLPEKGVVFCSFNAVYKITPDVFDIWCRLLREVPGSVLWILSSNGEANANLRREAQARDVEASRLIFAPRASLTDHLARFRCADLFLDTFPCTAHTTASDALWCGVPVITRIGETFASRVAASILNAAGLAGLVTGDAASYHDLARRLATNPPELTALKQHLDEVRYTCPLFDSAAYTRDLETLYRSVARHD